MSTIISPPSPAALEAVKARQQAAWAAGDYGQIGVRVQLVGETLCEAADVRGGERVLDVAAGNGNASLAAARRFANVVSTDYVPALLEAGRRRAEADGLPIEFRVADAESLPFPDASFDVALSTFGVMFAPDAVRVASELLRVVRPGGRVALASWTPTSFVGEMFATIGRFLPPPAGVRPPTAWGDEPRLVELFGPSAQDLRTARRTFAFRFLSAAHFVDVFRRFYGPMVKAFDAVGPDRRDALAQALEALCARHDVGGGRGLVVPSEYLEAVIVR